MTKIADFHGNSKSWYSQDQVSFECKTIESITLKFGLYELINEPTHLLEKSILVHRPNTYIAIKLESQIRCSPIPLT